MENEVKHTPGPWEIGCVNYTHHIEDVPNIELLLPSNDSVFITGSHRTANARLITAVPDLLEIVEALKVWYDAATDGKHVNSGPVADALLFDNNDSLHERINSVIKKVLG